MRVCLDIPDEFAAALSGSSQDPARAALEAWSLEAYRRRRLSGYQLRTLLGFQSRWDLDGFLKEHQVDKYNAEDFADDLATIRESRNMQKRDRHPA